ncbi:tRNA epoxyqueuosine(34) reductase QueG [Thiolapillus sp.]
MSSSAQQSDYRYLAGQIRRWARELGFQQTGITDTNLELAGERLRRWVALGRHGDMDYMWKHGSKRHRPEELVPGTVSVISVRMDYLPPEDDPETIAADPAAAFISRYALGRDYHKLMRKRLQKLAGRISEAIGAFGYRVFVDSAPVLEKPLAVKAGLGWMGKHTCVINREAGSWFFLGELYTDLPLPLDQPEREHCGRCSRCMDICPTQAIVAPYELDARLCISWLTIELQGSIPEYLRPLMGNRIYGCDDCMRVCPWNRFATPTPEADFLPRQGLDKATLLELFRWNEESFLKKTEGSPIRRIGHQRWLRNIAVALGNSKGGRETMQALQDRLTGASDLVAEHIRWAVQELELSDSGRHRRRPGNG